MPSTYWFVNNFLLLTLFSALAVGGFSVFLHKKYKCNETTIHAKDAEETTPPTGSLAGFLISSSLMVSGFLLNVSLAYFKFELTFYDADIFYSSLRGEPQYYTPPIWPSVGRFFPLTHQEFQFLSYIDTSGLFYIIFSASELLLACIIMQSALRLSLQQTTLLYIALLLSAPLSRVYTGLVYGERNFILLMAFMLWCFDKYLQHGRPVHVFFGAAAIVPMLLYKETAFVFPLTIGSLCILGAASAARARPGQGHNTRALFGISAPMLALPVLFLAFYVLFIIPRVDVRYGTGFDPALALSLLFGQVWVWFFAAVVAARTYALASGKVPFTPLWDGLLLAGGLYAAANVYLGLGIPYYHAPAVFAVWGYALFLLRRLETRMAAGRAVFLSYCAVALLQLPQTAEEFRRWKEMGHSNASTARFIADYYAAHQGGETGRPLAVLAIDPPDPYIAGIIAGFANAKYGTPLTMSFLELPKNGPLSRRCLDTSSVICRYGVDEREMDIALLFQPQEPIPSGYRLLFESDPVGFWANTQRLRVVQRAPPPDAEPGPPR